MVNQIPTMNARVFVTGHIDFSRELGFCSGMLCFPDVGRNLPVLASWPDI